LPAPASFGLSFASGSSAQAATSRTGLRPLTGSRPLATPTWPSDTGSALAPDRKHLVPTLQVSGATCLRLTIPPSLYTTLLLALRRRVDPVAAMRTTEIAATDEDAEYPQRRSNLNISFDCSIFLKPFLAGWRYPALPCIFSAMLRTRVADVLDTLHCCFSCPSLAPVTSLDYLVFAVQQHGILIICARAHCEPVCRDAG